MAIDFPGSPSLGQRHSHSNTTWEWDGSSWNRITIDLYTTDAVTLSGIAATQFARRDDDNIITGVTTFIGNGYAGVGNTVLIVEGDARVTGVLSVGQGSVSINERDIYAVGVVTGANFKTGTTNVHNVGVEAAGINVLGADTPIGTGATVYNSGLIVGKKGAEFQGVVTASAFSGDGSGLVGVAATDFVHAQTLQVNGISTFAGVTTVTSETFFSKQGNFTGVVTASAFVGDGSGITGVANTDFVHAQTLKVSGISTFSDILVRNISASGITTFEDTKNIDSIGIITARDGIVVSSGTLKADGLVGAAGSVLSSTGSGINWVSPQTGPQGAQGHQGVQGAAGAAGAQGHQGVQGTAGSSGGTGPQGVQGAQGHQGVQGAVGAQGAQGVQGAVGAQGAQGHQGRQGTQGVQGATANLTIATTPPGSPAAGDLWWDSDDSDLHVYFNDGNSSQWVNINSGSAGAQGAVGAQGAQGYQGVQGSVGIASLTIATTAPSSPDAGDMWWESDTGNLGIYFNDGNSSQWVNINAGPSGAQGAAGAQGAQGHQGVQGAQGHQGVQGAAGAQGAQGHQGVQGATGSGGAAGAQGAQGHQGVQGAANATTINNNANNKVITGSGSANTLEAEASLTFDAGLLKIDDLGGTAGKGRLEFGNSGEQYIEGYDTGNAGSSSYLTIGSNTTERLRIDNNGNLTLGDVTSNNYGSSLGQLRIINNANSTPASFALFGYGNTTTGDTFAKIQFAQQESGFTGQVTAEIGALAVGTDERGTDLIFKTRPNTSGSSAAERVRITSTGFVGINQTAPGVELDIKATSPEIRLTCSEAGLGSGETIGQIGWYTTDPTTPGGAGTVSYINTYSATSNGSDYTTVINNRAGAGGGSTFIKLGNALGTITLGTNTAGNAGAERLRIDSGGSVTIGDAATHTYSAHSEGDDLVVGGSGWRGMSIYGTSGGVIQFADAASNRIGQIVYNHGADSMDFRVNGNQTRLMINSTGGVGIGTVSYASDLDNRPGLAIHSDHNDSCRLLITTPTKSPTRLGYFGLNRFGMDVQSGFEIRDVASSYATRFLINSSGMVTTPNQPGFLAIGRGGYSASIDNNWAIVYPNSEVYDTLGNHNLSTGTFTAPVGGKYLFYCYGLIYPMPDSNFCQLRFVRNGSTYGQLMQFSGTAGNHRNVSMSVVASLSANDTFAHMFYRSSGQSQNVYGGQWNWGGVLLG